MNKRLSRNVKRTVFVLLLILLVLSAMEASIRLHKRIKRPEPTLAPHPQLGWVANPKQGSTEYLNHCGESVTRAPVREPLLVKRPSHEGAISVLFVGDSFTRALQVSTGHAYYDRFEERVPTCSVFAAGVSGYSTYQEYLMVQDLIPTIQPDMVVWQLSENDVINNVYDLDSTSSLHSPLYPRPYFDPDRHQSTLRTPRKSILQVSHLARIVFKQAVKLERRWNLKFLSRRIASRPINRTDWEAGQRRGLQVVETLLANAATDFPDVRFVGFCVTEGMDEEFAAIFQSTPGCDYVPGVAVHLSATPNTDCLPLDAHWNHLGHDLVGQYLAEHLAVHVDSKL